MPSKQFFLILLASGAVLGFGWLWQDVFSKENVLVVYFGRPAEIPRYLSDHWFALSKKCLYTALTAIASLVLAGFVATSMLAIGLLNDGWLRRMETFTVWSQAVPFLVIVTIFFLAEKAAFKLLGWDPVTGIYSLGPVTVSLIFPPLVYGTKSIFRMQVQIKSLLRLWKAPISSRIRRVYIPSALPDILTGLRVSAAWAVGATLISDGLLDGVAMGEKTLGHLLLRPFSMAPSGQTPTVIVLATILAISVYFLFEKIQTYVERWLLGDAVKIEDEYSIQ